MQLKHKRFDHLPSTQDYVLANLQSLADYELVSCEYQTAGYGRSGLWDGKQANIYCSLKLPHLALEINELILVSLFEFLQQLSVKARIKLPNDLYIDKQKLAGFIVNYADEAIIVGIGLNISISDHPERIGLMEVTKIEQDIIELIAMLHKVIYQNSQLSQLELNYLFNNYLDVVHRDIDLINRQTQRKLTLKISKVSGSYMQTNQGNLAIMNYKFP